MVDRGPNPDLRMVKSGPRQPLKIVFYLYTKVFIPKSNDLIRASEPLIRR